mgnify:CR=1 FL=1
MQPSRPRANEANGLNLLLALSWRVISIFESILSELLNKKGMQQELALVKVDGCEPIADS